jgi:hypothetical protein
MQANAHTLTFVQMSDTRTDLIDHAGYFVSRRAWILDGGVQALFRHHIAVADSARLNTNPDSPRPGLWNLPLHDFNVRSASALAQLSSLASFSSHLITRSQNSAL